MKQFCEDCVHYSLEESVSKDPQFAKCHAAIQSEWKAMDRILRNPTKITVDKHFYCTTERTKDTCDNFEEKPCKKQ